MGLWNFLGNAHAIDFEVSERMTLLIPQPLRNYSQIKEKTNGEVVVWLDFVHGTLLVCANTETLSLEGI